MATVDFFVSVPNREIVQGEITDQNIDTGTSPANTLAAYTTDKTAFEAALATLVADGATPTQAHVTAANSAYTTFKADLTPTGGDWIELRVRTTDPVSGATKIDRRDIIVALKAFERFVINGGKLGTDANLPVS
jgi:hypothetical protein